MPEYVQVEVAPGVRLLVEAPEDAENGLVEAGRAADVAATAAQSLTSTLDALRSAASTTLQRLRSMDTQPSEVTLEFSIQLAAEAGVVVARTQTAANMKVALKWVNDQARSDASTPEEASDGPSY